VTDESSYELALSILVPMGEYFQVQDDVLDAFAEPEALGKIGTDILVRPFSPLSLSFLLRFFCSHLLLPAHVPYLF